METHCSYVSYEKTGYFSKLIIDYLNNAEALQPFYNYRPLAENIPAVINQKKGFRHREILVEELQKQYDGVTITEKTAANIQSLLSEQYLYCYNCTSTQYFYRAFICYLQNFSCH